MPFSFPFNLYLFTKSILVYQKPFIRNNGKTYSNHTYTLVLMTHGNTLVWYVSIHYFIFWKCVFWSYMLWFIYNNTISFEIFCNSSYIENDYYTHSKNILGWSFKATNWYFILVNSSNVPECVPSLDNNSSTKNMIRDTKGNFNL